MVKTYYITRDEKGNYIFSTIENEDVPRIKAEEAYLACQRALELGMIPYSNKAFRCKNDILTYYI